MSAAPLPPMCQVQERCLLATMLLCDDPGLREGLRGIVSADDFLDPDYAATFRAIEAMDTEGRPVSPVSVLERLKLSGDVDEVSGKDMLTDIVDHDALVSARHQVEAARDIRRTADRRRAMAAAEGLQAAMAASTFTDPADVYATMRAMAVQLEQIAERGDVKPQIDTGVEWISAPSPESPELVERLMRCAEVGVLNAPPKAGKSQIVSQLTLSIATGRPFLNELGVISPGGVLYLNYELNRATFENRMSAMCRRLGITADDLTGRLMIWHMRENPVDAFRAAEQIERMKFADLRLVIIDPLRNAYPAQIGGEGFTENSNAHMAALVRRLMQLATRTGASVLIVHHTTKGAMTGKSLTDQGAGAGSLSGGVDAHYSLTPHEEEGCHVLDGVNRSLPAFHPLVIQAEWPTHAVRHDLDPTATKRPIGRRTPRAATPPVVEKPADAWTVERFVAEVIGGATVTQDQAVMAGVEKGCKLHVAKALFKAARDGGKLAPLLKTKNQPQRFEVAK